MCIQFIGVEGTKTPRKSVSCVGKFKDVIQCPAGAAGQVRTRRSLGEEEAGGSPLVPGAEFMVELKK